jgi:hypothetical protein
MQRARIMLQRSLGPYCLLVVTYVTNLISLFPLGVRRYCYTTEVKEKLAYSGQMRAVAEGSVMIQGFSEICDKV